MHFPNRLALSRWGSHPVMGRLSSSRSFQPLRWLWSALSSASFFPVVAWFEYLSRDFQPLRWSASFSLALAWFNSSRQGVSNPSVGHRSSCGGAVLSPLAGLGWDGVWVNAVGWDGASRIVSFTPFVLTLLVWL